MKQANQLLLISQNADDQKFWSEISSKCAVQFICEHEPSKVRDVVAANPKCLVFWDTAPSEAQAVVQSILAEAVSPSRVFAITTEPVFNQPALFSPSVFSNHIYRRYQEPAPLIYSRLVGAAFKSEMFGLQRYFPEKFDGISSKLRRSTEKLKVLEDIGKFLEGHGVLTRISTMGVDAADELIMNALFDAPWELGRGDYRRGLAREADFELSEKEQVEVEVACCEEFIGIRVKDNFGTLKRESILKHLSQEYRSSQFEAPADHPGAGLGLQKLNQLAMALLFVTRPQSRTEVMVFFGNAKTFREFRLGFSFFSIMDREGT